MLVAGRMASVVLVHQGEVIGLLPPVSLEMPWWPEVHDLVTAVRERDGIEITVLRLLQATSDRIAGGEVTYLAETDRPPQRALASVGGDPLAEHPLRQTWARPGGPAELLAWAEDRLADRGIVRTGPAQQMRTWNLSALWRIPTAAGLVWLKAVPGLLRARGRGDRLDRCAGGAAADRLRPRSRSDRRHRRRGQPRGTRAGGVAPMVQLLTGLQQRGAGPPRRADGPRRSGPAPADDGPADRRHGGAVGHRARHWPSAGRWRCWWRACRRAWRPSPNVAFPDTLVHGDFHPGNVAGPAGRLRRSWTGVTRSSAIR